MKTGAAIEECVEQHPYNLCSTALRSEKDLIPLIAQRLNQLGIFDIVPFAAGNRSLVLRDVVNAQVIKLANPGEELWNKGRRQRALFKPFDITQHVECIKPDSKETEHYVHSAVLKIMPEMMLVKDLPPEEQLKAGTEYTDIFMKRTGIYAEYKPENIAIITDDEDKPVIPKHSGMSYLYVPIDLGDMVMNRSEMDEEFMKDYLDRGIDDKGIYRTTLERYYPVLRNKGVVIAQNNQVVPATRTSRPDTKWDL